MCVASNPTRIRLLNKFRNISVGFHNSSSVTHSEEKVALRSKAPDFGVAQSSVLLYMIMYLDDSNLTPVGYLKNLNKKNYWLLFEPFTSLK